MGAHGQAEPSPPAGRPPETRGEAPGGLDLQHVPPLDHRIAPLGVSSSVRDLLLHAGSVSAPALGAELEEDNCALLERHALDAEIRALKSEVVRQNDDLNATRKKISRGQLARAQSELFILQKLIEELQQERASLFATTVEQPLAQVIAQRVEGYCDEIQHKLGISASALDREVPEQLRFRQNGDGSFEAIAAFQCNTDPQSKKREYVDFRFAVPSTHSPVTIMVGPLAQQSFVLLSRRPRATESSYDQRTYPLADQGDICDAVKRSRGSSHSMVLKDGECKFVLGVYYVTVCTGGDKLEKCAVRLYIPTRRSPAMHYHWYGIGRHSGNKHAEEAANLHWKDAKESLKAQEARIRLAGGGLRRISGDKPHGQEVFTNTFDLRCKPVCHLYSRVEEHGNKADAQEDGRRRFREHGPEDVWTRLSKPLAFSTRVNKSERHEGLKAKKVPSEMGILQRPSSSKSGLRMQPTIAEEHAYSVSSNATAFGSEKTSNASRMPKNPRVRPASARPASAQSNDHGYDSVAHRRPVSASGRARSSGEFPLTAASSRNRERPRSAMARFVSAPKSRNGGANLPGSHGPSSLENPFSSIVSKDSRRMIESATGMTAEQQLDMMREGKAASVLNILTSTAEQAKADKEGKELAGAGHAKKLGLRGMLKVHKDGIQEMVERHGVHVLEKTLNDYEERDIERYKLPFAHVFMEVTSGRNIPRSPDNFCDPYVTVTLKDSEQGQIDQQKTSIEHSTPNPEWKSSLQFKCHHLELDADFTFVCCHHSSFAHVKDVALGHGTLELRKLKIGKHQEWTVALEPLVKTAGVGGESPKLCITTFYGKADAYAEWRRQEVQRQKAARKTLTGSFAKAKDPVAPEDGRRGKKNNVSQEDGLPDSNEMSRLGEASAISDSFVALFNKWSGAGAGQKGSAKSTSVDFKEWTELLKDLNLMPGQIGTHKAQEIYRQANRRAGDPTPDGNTAEMDFDEFVFALGKVGELCKVDIKSLLRKAPTSESVDSHTHTLTQLHRPDTLSHKQSAGDGRPLSKEELHQAWDSFCPGAWEYLGVGADFFEFLRSLQEQELGRETGRTIDFLQQPPSAGTAHRFADSETIDLYHINAPDELLLGMAQYGGSHIKTLRIGGNNKLTLRAIMTFVREFRFINSLSLRGHSRADDQWLRTLSEALHLQELIISECIHVTDEGLVSVSAASSGLRKIDCCNCVQITDTGILALGQNCTQIESLNIRGCLKVSNGALGGFLTSCPHVRHLDVAGLKAISSLTFCNAILSKLQSINVSNCQGLDDIALKHITRSGSLQSLTAYANGKITDVGLEAIASCSSLTTLSLARCPQVSDSGLLKITQGCRRLRSLNIDFCGRVTDTSLTFIADYNEELEHLSLRGCSEITCVGVRCVLKHCSRIGGLDVAHSGADETEVRTALTILQEERRTAQAEEDVPWLVGKGPTWIGIEADASWLPEPRAVECSFSNIEGGFTACSSTKFNPRRDLPSHLVVPYLLAGQDGRAVR